MLKEDVEATRRPLTQASTLAREGYTSAAWYQREVERIFMREWVCLGRADQIPKTGDYFRMDLVGEPVVVVRDTRGTVRAFSAVCRHRGAVLVCDDGHCSTFRCPYHSWTYSLEGQLLATPGRPHPMDDVENFDRADYGLVQLRVETWEGFVFVNLDAQAPPLHQWLGDLPAKVENYELGALRTTKRFSYEVACNWKVYLENGMEPYHVDTVHRRHVDPTRRRVWTFDEQPGGPYETLNVMASISAIAALPVMDRLTPRERDTTAFVWLQPNTLVILAPTYVKYRLYMPLGPERVRLVEHWCFPSSTIERPDFEATVGPAYYEKYDRIIEDDLVIAPAVQEGLRSRFYRPGRYSPQELVVHKIANYVLDRVEER
jgi:choline monooxygenase